MDCQSGNELNIPVPVKLIIIIVFSSIMFFINSGCEKPSVQVSEKNTGKSEEKIIEQTVFRCMYEYKNELNTAKDCSSGRTFILDPQGETMEIKKYSEKYASADSSVTAYAEFEGFFSMRSAGRDSKQDTVVIPTRIILLDKHRKCN